MWSVDREDKGDLRVLGCAWSGEWWCTALARNATVVQQTANKDAKKKDGKAMFFMHQSLSNEIFKINRRSPVKS